MLDAQVNGTEAQAIFAEAAVKFSDEGIRKLIKQAAQDARAFVLANKGRYEEGGSFEKHVPILSEEELLILRGTTNVSAFRRSRNREVARERGFSNAINHALVCLGEVGVVDELLVAEQDSVIFDTKTEKFLKDLEQRRQGFGNEAAQMALNKVVKQFYASDDSSNTRKVRDDILGVLAAGACDRPLQGGPWVCLPGRAGSDGHGHECGRGLLHRTQPLGRKENCHAQDSDSCASGVGLLLGFHRGDYGAGRPWRDCLRARRIAARPVLRTSRSRPLDAPPTVVCFVTVLVDRRPTVGSREEGRGPRKGSSPEWAEAACRLGEAGTAE